MKSVSIIFSVLLFSSIGLSMKVLLDDPVANSNRSFTKHIRAIKADRALLAGADGSGVVVGVLGTGVDFNHPDLKDNILKPFPPGLSPAENHDLHGRGTAVAGIIAAKGDNGLGITGIAPEAKILAAKIMEEDTLMLDAAGSPIGFDAVLKVYQLVAAGPDVVAIPFTGLEPNLEEGYYDIYCNIVVEHAVNHGIFLVGSAGGGDDFNNPVDENGNIDLTIKTGQDVSKVGNRRAPSSCAGVMMVGAMKNAHKLSDFSNFADVLEIGAPGGKGNLLTSKFGGEREMSKFTHRGNEILTLRGKDPNGNYLNPVADTIQGCVAGKCPDRFGYESVDEDGNILNRLQSYQANVKPHIMDAVAVKGKNGEPDYMRWRGTHLSAAMVAGVAAQVLSKYPEIKPRNCFDDDGVNSAEETKCARERVANLRCIINKSGNKAKNRVPFPKSRVGNGMVDAKKALEIAQKEGLNCQPY